MYMALAHHQVSHDDSARSLVTRARLDVLEPALATAPLSPPPRLP